MPKGWVHATVEHVGKYRSHKHADQETYARVKLVHDLSDPMKAHVLCGSASPEVRNTLKEGDWLRVLVKRDSKGVRVVRMEVANYLKCNQ